MADIDRRTIRPAHDDAYIPDPDRGGKLANEGREVVWSPYWQGHLDKGNVVDAAAPEPLPAPNPAVVKVAAQPGPVPTTPAAKPATSAS